MSKFYGAIGFGISQETLVGGEPSGVWENIISERNYYGDVTRDSRRWNASGYVNDNLLIANQFSIVADKFAYEHLGAMIYLSYSGTNWKISDVEVQYPRLIIHIGGVYNGPTASASEEV